MYVLIIIYKIFMFTCVDETPNKYINLGEELEEIFSKKK